MSNTSTVSPYDVRATTSYDASGAGEALGAGIALAGICLVGLAVGAVTVARWLAEETPEDRAALDRRVTERRRERLQGSPPPVICADPPTTRPELTTVPLRVHELEPLLRTAEQLGYHRVSLGQPTSPQAPQPVLLCNATGERLAIGRNARGRLEVCTAGDRQRVQALVRQHTVDRAMEHFARQGLQVQTARLANGEMQIVAREHATPDLAEAAAIKTQVCTDGTAWVDVDGVRGPRCATLVANLAQAIGGEVTSVATKAAYFQLPGEPTHLRVQG